MEAHNLSSSAREIGKKKINTELGTKITEKQSICALVVVW